MKVLFLAPYSPLPARGGGQQRMLRLIELAARKHEIWLLSFAADDAARAALDPLRAICHVQTVPQPRHTAPKRLGTLLTSSLPDMALRGHSQAFADALAQLRAAVPFDVVQAESIEMVQYCQRGQDGALQVYDSFNAEFVIQRRAFWTDMRRPARWPLAGYSLIQWCKLRRYETKLPRHVDAAFAVSEDDAAILRSVAAGLPLAVVPNGVDTRFFAPGVAAAPPFDDSYVLFTGTLDYRANVDALSWFVESVLPRLRRRFPELRLRIVGRNAVPAVRSLTTRPGVDLVGEVADVRPWFDGAAAFVVPMRIGGGVRLKLLEALAMQCPVVATPMGAEGVAGLVPGTHALLAEQPEAFAAAVARVLDEPALAPALRSAGRRLVVEHYDWRAIVPRMIAHWEAWRAAQTTA